MSTRKQSRHRGKAIVMTLALLALSSGVMAGEWTEGTLKFVQGLNQEGNARTTPLSQIGLMMKGGKTFTADPRLPVVDQSGRTTTIDRVVVPAKVRFRADGDVVKELKVVETLPR